MDPKQPKPSSVKPALRFKNLRASTPTPEPEAKPSNSGLPYASVLKGYCSFCWLFDFGFSYKPRKFSPARTSFHPIPLSF